MYSGNDNAFAQEEENCSIKKPNFFIIGAPKCGTSAMHEYLRTHPNIFMSNIKEPHYFLQDKENRLFRQSLDEYLKLFQKSSHEHLVIGESSSSYLYSPGAINNIYKFNSDAKIMVMLRNPVEMVYSLHSQLYPGLENEPEFEKAWKLQEPRRKGQNIPENCMAPSLLQYAQVAKYGEQIERLFNIFPREQIKIILYDDFKKSTKTVYEDVLAFLEVPSDGKTEFPVVNPNTMLRSRIAWVLFFRNVQLCITYVTKFKKKMFKKIFKNENYITIPIVLQKILPRIIALNTKNETRKPLPSSFQSELENEFKDDIEKLSLLINKDLSNWCKQKN